MGQERLNTGYLRTVMESRGMRFGSAERTRTLLAGLSDEERGFLATCLRKVSGGVEGDAEFDAVSAVSYATSDEVHQRLTDCGLIQVDMALLYRWVGANKDGVKRIRDAAVGGKAEREQLAQELGARLLVEAEHGSSGNGDDEHAESSGHFDDGHEVMRGTIEEAGGRKRKTAEPWGTRDRAVGYARDESQVKAAAAAKHHVYVKSAALTFEIDKARRAEEGRRFTVRIEGAQGKEGRAYDWVNKVVIQLTAEELHQAAAVVLGMSDRMVASHHGDSRDKRVELRREQGSIMVRITRTGFSVAVAVGADHLYKVGLLFVRALSFNDPDVDPRVLLDTLRLTSSVVRVAEK